MRKICFITGSRAEYGLLYWLMRGVQKDPSLELQIIVTGMHLSPEFGLTHKEIEADFHVDKKIEMLLSSDTAVGISKSMGLAQISLAEAYAELNPDLLVLLGDRYEIFSAATAAMVSQIPIAHIHGGETTQGAFDEAIRHSITKMSHLHFVATEQYRSRVIQLGESSENVFNYGAVGIDGIKNLTLLTKRELEKSLKFKLGVRNILVTFHPVTLEKNTAKEQFQEILNALDAQKDAVIIFTKANSDPGGRIINRMIDDYVFHHPMKVISVTSLGQLRYFSLLKYVDVVIGNSSSGIIEVPFFKIATINIGERQKGRIKAKSIIDCEPQAAAITAALELAQSVEFKKILKKNSNPYGDGGASEKILNILRSHKLSNILKKVFNDLPQEN